MITWLVPALIVLPVLLDLSLSGQQASFHYLAPDSFYYHTVARNISEFGSPSFDGIHPTNSFHPLWQGALAILYGAVRAAHGDETFYLAGSLMLGAFALAAGIWLLMAALVHSRRALPAWIITLPVGAYALALVPYWVLAIDVHSLVQWSQGPFPLFGTLWSYVNGMESSLVLLVFGAMARIYVAPQGRWRAAALGLAGSALVLARLDHIFFVAFLLIPYLHRAWKERSIPRLRELALFSACLTLPLAGYLAFNQAYSSAWLPISGSLKTTFPDLTSTNLENLRTIILYPLEGELAVSRMYRATQVLIPILAALFFLWQSVRRPSRPLGACSVDSYSEFLRLTAAGVITLGSYDFLFVKTFAMGHWYTPVSILFVSLVLLEATSKVEKHHETSIFQIVVWAALSIVVFLTLQRRPTYHRLYADFYFIEAPAVRAYYGSAVPKLVEYDDGIIAFGTHFPALSGTGLELDQQASEWFRSGRLDELAFQRGFDRAACMTYCVPAAANLHVGENLGAAGALESIAIYEQQHPAEDCAPEYISGSGNFWILRCHPQSAAP